MRLGVFGGTFDPPHIAHQVLADAACLFCHFDQLLWVLTPQPPHKLNRLITPLGDRQDMLQAAIQSDPRFVFSTVDVDRPPPHYAVDTLRLLRVAHPGAELIYLMGSDSVRDIPTWHDPAGFLSGCDGLCVMQRPGVAPDQLKWVGNNPGLPAKVVYLEAPLLDVSSTEIRRLVLDGGPYRYLVPEGVFNIIRERRLYRLT